MKTTPRRPPSRRSAGARLVLPGLAAAAVLGACSSSPSPVALPPSPASGTVTSAGTPSAGTPGDAPAAGAPAAGPAAGAPAGDTSSASAVGAGVPHCSADRLRFRAAGSDGAAGTINVAVRVTNTGPGPCWTYGYPGLQILDGAGRALPTTTLHGAGAAHFQRPPVAKRAPQRVTLAAGAWGWFDVTYTQVPATTCPDGPRRGSQLSIIAPDTRTAATIPLGTSACHGDLGVSPVLPASAWVPTGPA